MLIRICCICFRVLQQGVVDDSLASHLFHDVRAQIHLVVFSYRLTITFSFTFDQAQIHLPVSSQPPTVFQIQLRNRQSFFGIDVIVLDVFVNRDGGVLPLRQLALLGLLLRQQLPLSLRQRVVHLLADLRRVALAVLGAVHALQHVRALQLLLLGARGSVVLRRARGLGHLHSRALVLGLRDLLRVQRGLALELAFALHQRVSLSALLPPVHVAHQQVFLAEVLHLALAELHLPQLPFFHVPLHQPEAAVHALLSHRVHHHHALAHGHRLVRHVLGVRRVVRVELLPNIQNDELLSVS